jgi:hypothetical protein
VTPARGRSSEAEHQLPKLRTRVRFPSPAPTSSVMACGVPAPQRHFGSGTYTTLSGRCHGSYGHRERSCLKVSATVDDSDWTSMNHWYLTGAQDREFVFERANRNLCGGLNRRTNYLTGRSSSARRHFAPSTRQRGTKRLVGANAGDGSR